MSRIQISSVDESNPEAAPMVLAFAEAKASAATVSACSKGGVRFKTFMSVGWMAIVCHAEVLWTASHVHCISTSHRIPSLSNSNVQRHCHSPSWLVAQPKTFVWRGNTQWQPGTNLLLPQHYHNLCRWIHLAGNSKRPRDFFVSSTAGKATRCSSARKNSLTSVIGWSWMNQPTSTTHNVERSSAEKLDGLESSDYFLNENTWVIPYQLLPLTIPTTDHQAPNPNYKENLWKLWDYI